MVTKKPRGMSKHQFMTDGQRRKWWNKRQSRLAMVKASRKKNRG